MSDTRHQLHLKDVTEVAIGASILALPLAITQEAWDLGVSLPLINTVGIAVASVVILGLFIHHSFYAGTCRDVGRGSSSGSCGSSSSRSRRASVGR